MAKAEDIKTEFATRISGLTGEQIEALKARWNSSIDLAISTMTTEKEDMARLLDLDIVALENIKSIMDEEGAKTVPDIDNNKYITGIIGETGSSSGLDVAFNTYRSSIRSSSGEFIVRSNHYYRLKYLTEKNAKLMADIDNAVMLMTTLKF